MSKSIAAVILTLNVALTSKNDRLVELKDELDSKENEIANLELDQDDFISDYETMLDESSTGYLGWSHSYILKELDPTAYRCGLVDYVDSLTVEDHHEDYDQLEGEREDLESDIEDLESNIEDLEMKIEDAENEA